MYINKKFQFQKSKTGFQFGKWICKRVGVDKKVGYTLDEAGQVVS